MAKIATETENSLGRAIRDRRKELGLTQWELANLVDDNVQQSDISALERGKVQLPRRSRLEKIARALQLSSGELLARSGWNEASRYFDDYLFLPVHDWTSLSEETLDPETAEYFIRWNEIVDKMNWEQLRGALELESLRSHLEPFSPNALRSNVALVTFLDSLYGLTGSIRLERFVEIQSTSGMDLTPSDYATFQGVLLLRDLAHWFGPQAFSWLESIESLETVKAAIVSESPHFQKGVRRMLSFLGTDDQFSADPDGPEFRYVTARVKVALYRALQAEFRRGVMEDEKALQAFEAKMRSGQM